MWSCMSSSIRGQCMRRVHPTQVHTSKGWVGMGGGGETYKSHLARRAKNNKGNLGSSDIHCVCPCVCVCVCLGEFLGHFFGHILCLCLKKTILFYIKIVNEFVIKCLIVRWGRIQNQGLYFGKKVHPCCDCCV